MTVNVPQFHLVQNIVGAVKLTTESNVFPLIRHTCVTNSAHV